MHLGLSLTCLTRRCYQSRCSTPLTGARRLEGILKEFFKVAKAVGLSLGRLIFVESHIYGRNAHSALRILSRHIHGSPFVRVDKELRKALIFLRDRVLVSQPKVVSCQYKDVRHIYTDACFETRLAGVGGVAYDGNAVIL